MDGAIAIWELHSMKIVDLLEDQLYPPKCPILSDEKLGTLARIDAGN